MQKKNQTYSLGLDIGIASVGWCLLGEERIIDLGVRAFDKAETAKEGDSLNLVRRTARLMRRRLRRRSWRLTKLARTLKRHGVISDTNIFQPQHPFRQSLWQLRVDALDRQLTPEEWARVIYHLCKHRGFHWISRAEEKKAEGDKAGEGGKVKKGLAGTQKLMTEKEYRTAAEMVLAEFTQARKDEDGKTVLNKHGEPLADGAVRNKAGDYGKSLSRVVLSQELTLLFERQHALGNPHADTELRSAIFGNGDRKSGLFWSQKPALSGGDLLKMLGHCTFEKSEYRAPKASFTAERHVWLTRLNNLRIVCDGITRSLNEQERQLALPLPYQQVGDFTYKQLRAALVKAGRLPDSFRFTGLSYPTEAQNESGKARDPEGEKLVRLPAWQELRARFKKACLETEWEGLAGAAMDGRPETLDRIAWVLSVFKDDEEVERELRALNLPGGETAVQALLEISFDKFHALSLKALRRIVPHMEIGLRYDEAVAAIPEYGHHSLLQKPEDGKQKYLPPLYAGREKDGRMLFSEDMDIPRNPVVLRALNQARKVVNAIIRKYGAPQNVHIEMARDLSRPLDERRTIEKEQKEYRERNEKDKALFAESFDQPPKGAEFEKWRLYREQQGKCAYSIRPINLHRLLEPGYVEIDHALPYSRSFDDSKNNKVLVLTEENRNKGNRTPFEYLDGKNNSPRWEAFRLFVETNKAYRLAKRSRLLRKDFGVKEAEEFRERNLNDTRYICKFFKNYVERYLQLADGSEAKRCVVLSGQTTSFLRTRWGLLKVRGDSDRHHALDAAVVAACSHGMIKRMGDYARHKELEKVREGFIDLETGEIVNPAMLQQLQVHFPEPWPHFRTELYSRLGCEEVVNTETGKREVVFHNDAARLAREIERLGTYPAEALAALRPLFVSRAVQRRGSSAIHEETIRSAKFIEESKSFVRTPLQKLKLADLDNIVGATFSHNHKLITLLRERLTVHDNDGKKAFAEPVFKPSSSEARGPEVKKVKLFSTQKGGIRVRGGVAELGPMHHVDVFRNGNAFLIKPAYVADERSRVSIDNLPEKAEFLFSLIKHEYVEISLGTTTCSGYFVMYESDGRLTLRAHDQPQPDKSYFRRSVSSASAIRKFHVDVLGNIYPAPMEPRRGLA